MRNPLKDIPNWPVLRERVLVPAGARVRGWRDWVVANDPLYAAARRPDLPEKIAASVTLLLITAIVLFLLVLQPDPWHPPVMGDL